MNALPTTAPTTGVRPLLRPTALGDLRLPNRVVMAPVTRARATGPGRVPTELHAEYYAQRAGAGLIITEGAWVSPEAVGFVHVPGIHSAAQVAGWRRVTDLVHALGGRIVLQLWHTGAASHPDHLGGRLPAGPSAVDPRVRSFTPGGFKPTVTPREMTAADIAAAVAGFRTASANARRAGFDGVEIGALGPFLLPQFLSPLLNRRTDAYGGDRVRRRRLLLEVVDAVAEPWAGRRVGVRLGPYLSASDRFPADEAALADHDALVTELDDRPLAYLHLRGPDGTEPGAAPDFAAFARCRRRFSGPLIVNNGFDGESGDAVLDAGLADAVSYATHFIANPDLVTRFALGRPLTAGDPATYYTGGAAGYVDYPPSGA
ncbi:alkene reductase [Streptomyces sp. Ru73]|uniref:alkene reductase n=1 Tax=Streptomyces sp. Ru73 TaxID=2080748 RepID=UPI000CDE1BC0|nr:alkene reductase [Streptomyces sp. Ru73]POX39119.1 alkene reductase [Streptomyces sp. Ru73]